MDSKTLHEILNGVSGSVAKPFLPPDERDAMFPLRLGRRKIRPSCQGGGCTVELCLELDAYYGADPRGKSMCTKCRRKNRIS